MLKRVWQELEYCIDVCRVTRGAHIENLQKFTINVPILITAKFLLFMMSEFRTTTSILKISSTRVDWSDRGLSQFFKRNRGGCK